MQQIPVRRYASYSKLGSPVYTILQYSCVKCHMTCEFVDLEVEGSSRSRRFVFCRFMRTCIFVVWADLGADVDSEFYSSSLLAAGAQFDDSFAAAQVRVNE